MEYEALGTNTSKRHDAKRIFADTRTTLEIRLSTEGASLQRILSKERQAIDSDNQVRNKFLTLTWELFSGKRT